MARIDEPGGGTGLGGEWEVRIFQDNIGVAAAQFVNPLLEGAPRLHGHPPAGLRAARQGHRRDAIIGDDPRDFPGFDADHREKPLGRPRRLHQGLDRDRAPGDIGRVLNDHGIAGHEGRCRRSKDLPVREIPGHDSQEGSQWLKDHLGSRGRALGGVGEQQPGALLRAVPADQCRFADFGQRLGDGLSHLGADEGCPVPRAVLEGPGDASQELGTRAQGGLAPPAGGLRRLIEDPIDLASGVGTVRTEAPSGGRIT